MTQTTTRGFAKVPANSPDANETALTALDSALDAIDQIFAVEVESANGAIGIKEGTAFITKASAAALTLAAPVSGLPSAAGDDGKCLRIIATTAAAHTVTTPANKLNGATHVATFGGAIGDCLELFAYGGVWYTGPIIAVVLT
jgi:hypothetical protein